MRLSRRFIASSAIAVLATVALGEPAVSQITPGPAISIPSVTVDAPKQVARPQRSKPGTDGAVARRRASPAAQSASSGARPAAFAPDSIQGRIARLERSASSCNGGCETSFRVGNQPWIGCSLSGAEVTPFDGKCSDTLTYRHYADCQETKALLGWERNKIWWHCSSLQIGGKFRVAELKRARR
ncbi:hypothetical protein [Bradyrhizobium sp. STM 3809]|uniref:hypothetical protein n=1 Tax=Bradyrhizobium sp. STM 3809 TaxID=551936 RepID=UPI0002409E3D|nr:hypothetical protein [Bradyrhizobium sp. STM 3809]CCE02980.1 conserved exported hypothetical protein [Bradyrhizobium sp. STM 3809]